MYQNEFPQADMTRLREYVLSEEYRALKDGNTNYYLAARLRAHLGEKPAQRAEMLVQATWEAQSGAQYERYAAEALAAYQQLLTEQSLTEESADPEAWLTAQLVAGELERRLGRFADAKMRFLMLAKREEVRSGILAAILQLQLQLIEAKDNQPQLAPQKDGDK
jgi:hypothetical protein